MTDVDPFARLDSFTELPANWDTYSASPISADVVAEAKRLLRLIQKHDLPDPAVVPVSDGSVDFEWSEQVGGVEQFLVLGPKDDLSVSYYLSSGDDGEEASLLSDEATEVVLTRFRKLLEPETG